MIEQSFVKSLFYGTIAESMLFPFPTPPASEVEQLNLILRSVRKFCLTRVDSAKIDREASLGPDVLHGLKELGLFGMIIPQEYGGVGLSNTGFARVMHELGGFDSSVALTVGAHQAIGLKGLLLYGSEAQKRSYLPRLASGDIIAAFALTEPGAGSDAAAIRTHAELLEDGRSFLLTGSKIWATNGEFADLFTVFARTSANEEGLKPRITALLVERGWGVATGPNERKLGIRGASTTPVFLDGVKVPVTHVLGERGHGFRVAVEVLNSGRLSLASGCAGLCRRLIAMATERAQLRSAFGRNIAEFGLIKDKIATMITETYALESMVYLTTGLVDAGVADYAIESAICKVYGSETLWRTVNETLQIAAGIGYMQGFPYERMLRDSRIHLIFDGTNEILRCLIALSGAQGPGRTLADVARAMREPLRGLGLLGGFAVRRARSVLGRERLTKAHPLLAREALVFEQSTADLARNVDRVLRKYGRSMAEMQYTQRRIADVAIDLYAIAAMLARTTRMIEQRGEEGARREIDLTTAAVNAAEKRMHQNTTSFESNDDELRKAIASKAYTDGGYPLDLL